MSFGSDDRRRMNQEMWDREQPPVIVPSIDETNDYRVDPVFRVEVNGQDVRTSCGHVNKAHLLRMIDEEFENWHAAGAIVTITENGEI